MRRLLGDPGESYEGLLRYFRRTKELLDARGQALPTSRQAARARERQQRADVAPGQGQRVAAAGKHGVAQAKQCPESEAAAGEHMGTQPGQQKRGNDVASRQGQQAVPSAAPAEAGGFATCT